MDGKIAEDQVATVDEALSHWRQGDYVGEPQWFAFKLDPSNPLTNEAQASADADADIAEKEVPGLVVVTQTCDIVRTSASRPFVEVCPMVKVEDVTELQNISRGRVPRYAAIPGAEPDKLVADLDQVMTVEKAVVAGWERTRGCTSDAETRAFAKALARKRQRFAFPDDFNRFAGKLQNRIKGKHGKDSPEGEALRALREIRVRAAPDWDAGQVEIMLWFIRDEKDFTFRGTDWPTLLEKWMALIPEDGRFAPVYGEVSTLEDMRAKDYVESDRLDLDHLSIV